MRTTQLNLPSQFWPIKQRPKASKLSLHQQNKLPSKFQANCHPKLEFSSTFQLKQQREIKLSSVVLNFRRRVSSGDAKVTWPLNFPASLTSRARQRSTNQSTNPLGRFLTPRSSPKPHQTTVLELEANYGVRALTFTTVVCRKSLHPPFLTLWFVLKQLSSITG